MTLRVLLPDDIALCSRIEQFACTLDQVLFASALMDPETREVRLYVGVGRGIDLGPFKVIQAEVGKRVGDKLSELTLLRGHAGELDARSKSTEQAQVS